VHILLWLKLIDIKTWKPKNDYLKNYIHPQFFCVMNSLHNRSSVSKFLYLSISIIRGCALILILQIACLTLKSLRNVYFSLIKCSLGSEIWGMFDTNSASCKKTSDYILEKVYASGITEKSHSRFMKYILGVNRKASYIAVMSELEHTLFISLHSIPYFKQKHHSVNLLINN
jgi:hypothetical protein